MVDEQASVFLTDGHRHQFRGQTWQITRFLALFIFILEFLQSVKKY
jgi:hypothetical protein